MIKEIRAEMLLHHLYPHHEGHWTVDAQGTFYRNYNSDIMSIDEETGLVSLARDGLLRLLPSELISPADEFLGDDYAQNREKMLWRQKLLKEAFMPFDTVQFAHSMDIERNVATLLAERDDYILSHFFGIGRTDVDAGHTQSNDAEDPLVREAQTLLPHIATLRGDLQLVRQLLAALLHCPVEMDLSHRYSTTESDRCWMPMVWYHIVKPGLDSEQYKEAMKALQPLTDFIREWLIPCDVVLRIDYRQHTGNSHGDTSSIILGYNSKTV